MNNRQKFMVVFTAAYVLLVGGMIVHSHRYELGITKPKFKEGSCICTDLSDEFKKNSLCYIVLKVGKKEYQTLWYEPETNLALPYTNSLNIEYNDSRYEQVSCPKDQDGHPLIKVIR